MFPRKHIITLGRLGVNRRPFGLLIFTLVSLLGLCCRPALGMNNYALPLNWTEKKDENGKAYYYNSEFDVAQVERPTRGRMLCVPSMVNFREHLLQHDDAQEIVRDLIDSISRQVDEGRGIVSELKHSQWQNEDVVAIETAFKERETTCQILEELSAKLDKLRSGVQSIFIRDWAECNSLVGKLQLIMQYQGTSPPRSTAKGYEAIAKTFAKNIVDKYESDVLAKRIREELVKKADKTSQDLLRLCATILSISEAFWAIPEVQRKAAQEFADNGLPSLPASEPLSPHLPEEKELRACLKRGEDLKDGDRIDVNYWGDGTIWKPATFRAKDKNPDIVWVEYDDNRGAILRTIKNLVVRCQSSRGEEQPSDVNSHQ